MKKMFLAIALVMAPMALGGCATIARITGQEQASAYDERALLTAEYSFQAASTAIAQADRAGLLTPERAAAIRPAYTQAYEALGKARALYDANAEAEAGGETQSAVLAVAALIQALINNGILER